MSAPTQFRLSRAGVFAAVCVSVSMGGHVTAGGAPVPVLGVMAGFLFVWGIAWAVARRECGYGTILAWLLWGQLALHLTFHQAQIRLAPLSGTAEPSTGHLAHHPPMANVETGGSAVSMLFAHLTAALISAWWLRCGEASAFALAQTLHTLLVPPLLVRARPSPCVPAPVAAPTATLESPALHGTVLADVRTLRGPPFRTSTR